MIILSFLIVAVLIEYLELSAQKLNSIATQ